MLNDDMETVKWDLSMPKRNSSGKAVSCFPKRPASEGGSPHSGPLLPPCGEGLAVSLCLCWFHFSFPTLQQCQASSWIVLEMVQPLAQTLVRAVYCGQAGLCQNYEKGAGTKSLPVRRGCTDHLRMLCNRCEPRRGGGANFPTLAVLMRTVFSLLPQVPDSSSFAVFL